MNLNSDLLIHTDDLKSNLQEVIINNPLPKSKNFKDSAINKKINLYGTYSRLQKGSLVPYIHNLNKRSIERIAKKMIYNAKK